MSFIKSEARCAENDSRLIHPFFCYFRDLKSHQKVDRILENLFLKMCTYKNVFIVLRQKREELRWQRGNIGILFCISEIIEFNFDFEEKTFSKHKNKRTYIL